MVQSFVNEANSHIQDMSEPAATTPAIVVIICIGAGLLIAGVGAIGFVLFRRRSSSTGKGGVYLSSRTPNSEQIPLQSHYISAKRADATRSTHLVMKKSPSPPYVYSSPSPSSKLGSPISPPSGCGEVSPSRRLSCAPKNEIRSNRDFGSICVTTNPAAVLNAQVEVQALKTAARPRSSSLVCPSHSSEGNPRSHLGQEKKGGETKSSNTSPQTSPTSCSLDMVNEKNGNLENSSQTDSSPSSLASVLGSSKQESHTKDADSETVNIEKVAVMTGGGQGGLGVLHFRVRYKEKKGALVVTVVKCEDLPVKDTTLMTCDPYVKLQLLPEKQQRVKTRVLRHTRQPSYDEDFTFFGIQPNQLQTLTLHFVILSFDRYSRDDVIGEIFFPLQDIQLMNSEDDPIEISNDIQPRSLKIRNQGRGEVLVSLCWQPTSNRLTVVVLKARNLPKMDVTGLADPYVKLYLMYDGQRIAKKKTHIKKRTLNPVYNESFVFDLPPITGQANNMDKVSLQLILLDWDRVTKNEVIGRLELGKEGATPTTIHHWNEVLNCPRRQIAEWHKLRD